MLDELCNALMLSSVEMLCKQRVAQTRARLSRPGMLKRALKHVLSTRPQRTDQANPNQNPNFVRSSQCTNSHSLAPCQQTAPQNKAKQLLFDIIPKHATASIKCKATNMLGDALSFCSAQTSPLAQVESRTSRSICNSTQTCSCLCLNYLVHFPSIHSNSSCKTRSNTASCSTNSVSC